MTEISKESHWNIPFAYGIVVGLFVAGVMLKVIVTFRDIHCACIDIGELK